MENYEINNKKIKVTDLPLECNPRFIFLFGVVLFTFFAIFLFFQTESPLKVPALFLALILGYILAYPSSKWETRALIDNIDIVIKSKYFIWRYKYLKHPEAKKSSVYFLSISVILYLAFIYIIYLCIDIGHPVKDLILILIFIAYLIISFMFSWGSLPKLNLYELIEKNG